MDSTHSVKDDDVLNFIDQLSQNLHTKHTHEFGILQKDGSHMTKEGTLRNGAHNNGIVCFKKSFHHVNS